MTLIAAHKELEDITLVKEMAHFKPVIEKKMGEIIKANLPFTRKEISKDEAKKLFSAQPLSKTSV